MTREEALKVTMPFGKHRGKSLSEVPEDYLRWLYEDATITSERLRTAVAVLMSPDGEDAPFEADQDAGGGAGSEEW